MAAKRGEEQSSFTDIIFRRERIYTCVTCYEEKSDLRELPCGHLECSECIERRLSRARRNNVDFLCDRCDAKCRGDDASSFPLATSALKENQSARDARAGAQRGSSGSARGDNSYEIVVREMDNDVSELLVKYAQKVSNLQGAEQEEGWSKLKSISTQLEYALQKMWEWARMGMEWIAERVTSFMEWMGSFFW